VPKSSIIAKPPKNRENPLHLATTIFGKNPFLAHLTGILPSALTNLWEVFSQVPPFLHDKMHPAGFVQSISTVATSIFMRVAFGPSTILPHLGWTSGGGGGGGVLHEMNAFFGRKENFPFFAALQTTFSRDGFNSGFEQVTGHSKFFFTLTHLPKLPECPLANLNEGANSPHGDGGGGFGASHLIGASFAGTKATRPRFRTLHVIDPVVGAKLGSSHLNAQTSSFLTFLQEKLPL